GGVVMHPAASKHKRHDARLASLLTTIDRGDDRSLIPALIGQRGEFVTPLSELAQLLNRREDEVRAAIGAIDTVRTFGDDGDLLCAAEQQSRLVVETVIAELRAHQVAHALAPGMDVEDARAKLPVEVPPRVFRILVDELSASGALVRSGNLLTLPGHR